MAVEYIHYGSNKFDINKFNPIMNRAFFNKPYGGLWASRINSKYSWKNWNENEQFIDCNEENSFKFILSENANVLEIHSHKDLDKIPQVNIQDEYSFLFSTNFFPDYKKLLCNKIDAIEVFISDDYELYWKLYGWDCDSILIMNPNIIKVI